MHPATPADDKLVFLHIPKTAGSSFTHILKSLYDENQIFHRMDGDELIDLLNTGKDDYRLYIGHYSYNVVSLFRQRPRLLTFLREPRERMISHYYYYQAQSDEAIAAMADRDKYLVEMTRQYNFMDFISLESPEIEQGFANVHTRQLAHSTSDAVPQVEADRQALLTAAISHLNTVDFIGIVEKFDASLQLFRQLFGLTTDIEPVSLNVNRSSRTDSAEIEIFASNHIARRRVELDLQLYEAGNKLFETMRTAQIVATRRNRYRRLPGAILRRLGVRR